MRNVAPFRSAHPSPISCGLNLLDIQETARYTLRHKKEVLINDYFRRVRVRFNYELWDGTRQNILAEGVSLHVFMNNGKIANPPLSYLEQMQAMLEKKKHKAVKRVVDQKI